MAWSGGPRRDRAPRRILPIQPHEEERHGGEAQRQRQNAGMYRRENSMLPEEDQQRLLFEGGYPVLAKVAKRKGLPYPHVNEQGEVEADAAWWATMQAAK